jgi:hypothetical protein
MFVAGDYRFADFIGSVFEQKETIDLVSSRHTAVFLFAPNRETAIKFDIGPGSGAYVRGQRLDKQKNAFLSQSLPVETVPISNFDNNYRREIERASITACHDIIDEFGLSHKDIPSWILFHRSSSEPIVVKTDGNDDIQLLIKFLKDLWEINIDVIKPPDDKASLKREKLVRAKQHTKDAKFKLDAALESWSESKKPLSTQTKYEYIDGLINNSRDQSIPREIVIQWHKYKSALNTASELENEFDGYLIAAKTAPSVLEENERKVEMLAKKYQTRFKLRTIRAKLSEFIRTITGVEKQAREMDGIVSRLKEVIGNDDA